MKQHTIGVIAGNFDVIHPGYIYMFDECKQNCDHLVVLLHSDPTIERPEKLKPILSVEERRKVLFALDIPTVISYDTEKELYWMLKDGDYSIRFLGDDYIGKPFTGDDLDIPIKYLSRDHGWSTTKYKQLIAKSIQMSEEQAKDQLIELLMGQVVDLSMMSKIELGDDVIAEIRRLKDIINE